MKNNPNIGFDSRLSTCLTFQFILFYLISLARRGKTPTHLRLERLRSEAAWLGTYLGVLAYFLHSGHRPAQIDIGR
jgi:hypothetical protein